MSTGPRVFSISLTWLSTESRSPRSHCSGEAFTPKASICFTVSASFSADLPAAATLAPSPARRTAIALPSPPLAPSTRAVRPVMPRSIEAPSVGRDGDGQGRQMMLEQRNQRLRQRHRGPPHAAVCDDFSPVQYLLADRQPHSQLTLEVRERKP